MTASCACLLAFAAAWSAPAQETQDQLLRLRDGRVLFVEVLAHDLDGLSVRMVEQGGRLRLDWGELFPGEAERLQSAFGYRNTGSAPEVAADRLMLVNGEQVVGRILLRDERNVTIQTRETTAVIPLARLAAPPDQVRVPAAQVLTPEQFYNERVVQVEAGDALRQYEFALELQAVFALEQAIAHLEQAERLARQNGDEPLLRRVAAAKEQIALSLENRVQAEALERVRQLIHRERFAQAEEELAAFGRDYPNSPLNGEYRQILDRFEEQRQAAMERHLLRHWFNSVVAILKRRALERDASVDSLMSWLESEVPQLVRRDLVAGLREMKNDLDESELDGLWAARLRHGPSRHSANFGGGTWLLGEDKARAGLDSAAAAEENDGKTPEQRELEERTRKYLENLERARRAASAAADEVEPEDWWRQATATERFQWLLAYYAEFAGDYQVVHVSFANCPSCGGSGVIKVLELTAASGKESTEKCSSCQHVGVRRSIVFR